MRFPTSFAITAFTSVALAKDLLVSVSNATGSLIFSPDSLQAAQGDTVTFSFWPKNHSVAQAAFASPCQPVNNGFWSGYIPDSSNQSVASTKFTYTVKNSSVPVWFYCSQGEHCQFGMVGVINPPQSGNKTLDAFKAAAKIATSNVAPKSAPGTGGAFNSSSSSSSSVSPSSSPTSSAGSSSTGSPTSSRASSTAVPTGAASHLTGSVAFAGLTGLFSYLLL